MTIILLGLFLISDIMKRNRVSRNDQESDDDNDLPEPRYTPMTRKNDQPSTSGLSQQRKVRKRNDRNRNTMPMPPALTDNEASDDG